MHVWVIIVYEMYIFINVLNSNYMYWNTQHNIFCDIISIGDTFITIGANGHEYVSSMHFMILIG